MDHTSTKYRKKQFTLVVIFFPAFLISCNQSSTENGIDIVVFNQNNFDLSHHSLIVDLNDQPETNWIKNNMIVGRTGNNNVLPIQVIDPNSFHAGRRLSIRIDLKAESSLDILLRKKTDSDSVSSENQTLAELWYKTGGHFENNEYVGGSEFKSFRSLRVPDECTDHSYFIKYEGPGWESDKIGYRLYLDWRNAIDIYGKKVDTIVLPFVGQDGYESYHEMADWGMDILKVGNSLGIGSLGYWDGIKANRVAETDSVLCTIGESGALFSEVLIDYYGWKINNTSIDLYTSLSIKAGSRATKYSIRYTGEPDHLCTGIVKSENTEFFNSKNDSGWNYMATWGNQSLADDMLGMAIIYRTKEFARLAEDEYSHVVIFNPGEGDLEYYFLAAWEKEPDGIKTKEDFLNYLDQQTKLLNNPVEIQVLHNKK
ncbi:MAG: DUF4861 family protein [Bacteroidales bacterium]|jgi:hypothetical protein